MTSRSFDSAVSRRSRRDRVTNEDVYDYALRVAYLSYLLTPRAPTQAHDIRKDDAKEHHSRLTNITAPMDLLGGLFRDVGRDGNRSVKFPEKLLRVLDTKMQNIAMGKDTSFSDQYFRGSIAVFWGSLKEPTFHRQMKENRKIEELILTFVSTATASLKKNPQLSGDAWKSELNKQIPMFIRMLRECFSNVSSVPPELLSRLDTYSIKLDASPPTDTGSDSGYSASMSPDPPVPGSSGTLSQHVSDMPLVQTVAKLFGYTTSQVQNDLSSIKQICTERAAVVDLKTCLKNISAGAPFPGCREDFEAEDSWHSWRTQELARLSQLMVMMVKLNPQLAGSESLPARPSRPTSTFAHFEHDDLSISRGPSLASRQSQVIPSSWDPDAVTQDIQDDDDAQVGHDFTYIPPSPKKFYKRLIQLCMEYDLRAMASLPEDQEVSLGILSPTHLELVNECALRWRINPTYRVACFLDIIKYKYEREEVPLECIPEGLQMVSKTVQDLAISKWPIDDVEYLAQVYGALFNIFLGLLYHTFENLGSIKYQDIEPYAAILGPIRESGLMSRYNVDVNVRVGELSERVREVAIQQYNTKSQEIADQHVGVNRALPLLLLTDWVEKQVQLLDKRFPEPVLGILDVVALAIDGYYPMFLNDLEYSRRRLLEGSMNQPSPDIPIEDIFSLYRRTRTLGEMYRAFCPGSNEDFDSTGYFRPYVQQWIVNTDSKTTQWVNNAIDVDKFETEGEEGHSSSIIDLFDSLKPPIDFLLDLKWADEYEEARFVTSLAKTISNAVQQYCHRIEDLFMTEMFPPPPPEAQEKDRMALLMERAKLTMGGERKVEPFNFTASSCIKLNNIEAARKLLDRLYQRIDIDKATRRLETLAPPIPLKTKERHLFTVKIVQAQNLPPNDSSSKLDTFVTLSDENGYRLAKTRTIYDTLEPRWSQEFDFSVDSSLWLMASVRDRALIGKHDTIGRAYLCLDPKRYGDFLTHDLRLDLDPQGQAHIRVSMEGEKDDAQFYFGRAFRSLKRTEDDMTRVFIDKMSPLIKQCLSRNVLKTLMKSGVPATLDYSRAFGNFKGFFGSSLRKDNGDILIPLPAEERPRHRPGQISSEETELSISPLFAYFEKNLMDVLNQWLSDDTRSNTVLKVWKEILNVIEALLIPPLSELPSDMVPLSDKEVDVVFEWLRLLKDFFHADSEGPISIEVLQGQKYRDIQSIRLYYDWKTDDLMEECVRVMTQGLSGTQTLQKRAKSVYHHKNLGTIKNRKKEKQEKTQNVNDQIILRILRMRPNTSDFIATQMRIMAAVQAEQENKTKRRSVVAGNRKTKSPLVPSVPPLPRQ